MTFPPQASCRPVIRLFQNKRKPLHVKNGGAAIANRPSISRVRALISSPRPSVQQLHRDYMTPVNGHSAFLRKVLVPLRHGKTNDQPQDSEASFLRFVYNVRSVASSDCAFSQLLHFQVPLVFPSLLFSLAHASAQGAFSSAPKGMIGAAALRLAAMGSRYREVVSFICANGSLILAQLATLDGWPMRNQYTLRSQVCHGQEGVTEEGGGNRLCSGQSSTRPVERDQLNDMTRMLCSGKWQG